MLVKSFKQVEGSPEAHPPPPLKGGHGLGLEHQWTIFLGFKTSVFVYRLETLSKYGHRQKKIGKTNQRVALETKANCIYLNKSNILPSTKASHFLSKWKAMEGLIDIIAHSNKFPTFSLFSFFQLKFRSSEPFMSVFFCSCRTNLSYKVGHLKR